MAAKEFPLVLFQPGGFHLWPVATRLGGGAALAGPGQSADWSAGGWWAGEIKSIRLSRPDQHRAWRAMQMHLSNGGQLIMPIIDDPQRPMEDASLGPGLARFNDGATFSDGGTFQSHNITFELAEPAQEGDTEALIRRVTGRPLLGGEYFSFNHPEAGFRGYCIEDLDAETPSGVRAVQFGVPLRTDLSPGAFADFERPRITMEPSGDPKESWPDIRPPFRADVSIRLVESFDYL